MMRFLYPCGKPWHQKGFAQKWMDVYTVPQNRNFGGDNDCKPSSSLFKQTHWDCAAACRKLREVIRAFEVHFQKNQNDLPIFREKKKFNRYSHDIFHPFFHSFQCFSPNPVALIQAAFELLVRRQVAKLQAQVFFKSQSYGKWSFLVDVPIKTGAFPW